MCVPSIAVSSHALVGRWIDTSVQNFITAVAGSVWHPSGTLKMGPQHDKSAVVDAELKVHGIDNLRVADMSVTPLLPRYVPSTLVLIHRMTLASLLTFVDLVVVSNRAIYCPWSLPRRFDDSVLLAVVIADFCSHRFPNRCVRYRSNCRRQDYQAT